MFPSLAEIRSVTSRDYASKKKEEKTTAVKYKPFSIAIPCGLNIIVAIVSVIINMHLLVGTTVKDR